MKFTAILILASLALLTNTNAFSQNSNSSPFQAIDLSSKSGQTPKHLFIHAFGQDFQLKLEPNSALLAALPAKQRRKVLAADLFLRGTLEGVPGSWVRLNRVDGRFTGGFFDGNELYLIDAGDAFPAAAKSGVKAGQTVVFRFADIQLDELIDHGGEQPADTVKARATDYQTFSRHLREIASLKGGAMLALPVTIVSDVQFTERHGANAASVVAGRINLVDGIFSSQVGVGLQLLHHEILTDNDVLTATNSSHLLSGRVEGGSLVQPGFRQFMVSGAGSGIPFAGVAHLFTGRNLDGSTIGRAFIGVLCSSSFGYGIDQNLSSNTRSALLFAHELGHNFDAPHDNDKVCANDPFAGIMNSRLNGSDRFSDCSLDEMAPEVASASCLVEVFENPDVFSDGFESN